MITIVERSHVARYASREAAVAAVPTLPEPDPSWGWEVAREHTLDSNPWALSLVRSL